MRGCWRRWAWQLTPGLQVPNPKNLQHLKDLVAARRALVAERVADGNRTGGHTVPLLQRRCHAAVAPPSGPISRGSRRQLPPGSPPIPRSPTRPASCKACPASRRLAAATRLAEAPEPGQPGPARSLPGQGLPRKPRMPPGTAPLFFLLDLARAKSSRARPVRRGRIYRRQACRWPLACGPTPSGNGPADLPLEGPLTGPGRCNQPLRRLRGLHPATALWPEPRQRSPR